MRSPLEQRINALRARARRVLALRGAGWVVAGGAVGIILAALADRLVPGHLAREVRLALLVGIVGMTAYLIARYVVMPLIVRFQDLEIALKVERRWPGLNDRLASTVQFLRMGQTGDHPDLLGSQAMRNATIAQTLEEIKALDFRAVVDPRPARWAVLGASGSALLGVLLFAADPASTRIALERLFRPFGATQWPRFTHLTITRAPGKVARGEEFRLEVAVAPGERVPTTAKVTYTPVGKPDVVEPLRLDDRGRFHGRIEAVDTSFAFTVEAGDDRTAPRTVEVVPPPSLAEVSIRLVPPPYTSLPTVTLAPGRTQLAGVRGTKVEVVGAANKPLASATLRRGEGVGVTSAVPTSQNGKQVSTTFTLDESGPFWFDLVDREGFRSQPGETSRFEARAEPDADPTVAIDEPTNDRDVTPNATVPVRITADDDLGLGPVRLVYKVASGGSEPTAPPVVVPLAPAPAPGAPIRKHVELAYTLNLEPLKLSPGSAVTLYADARDLDAIDPKGPKLGKSREIRLRIVTAEEIQKQLELQRLDIYETVVQLAAMERQAQSPVHDARRTLGQTDKLAKPARDELANAAVIQRQLGGRVSSPTDGLNQKIQKYLDDAQNMKVDNQESTDQMREMKAGVDRIEQDNLAPAEQGLTEASKALDDPADGDPAADAGDPKAADAAQPKAGAPKAQAARDPAAKAKADPSLPGAGDAQPKADGQPETGKSDPQAGQPKAAGKPPAGGQPKAAGQPEAGKSDPQAGQPEAQAGQPEGGKPESKAGKPEPGGKPSPSQPAPKGQNPKADAAKEALAQAEANQQQIADELGRMADSLKEFYTYRGVTQDAKKLLKDQEDAMKAAAAAAKADTAGKAADQLDPQQKADLANAAARQAEAAQELAKLQSKMEEMAGKLGESDPLGAAALKEAAAQSRKADTAGKMDQAAGQLQKNQVGEAQTAQKQAQQDLKDLVDNLSNRREYELSKLVKELKQAEKDLKALKARQKQNQKDTKQAAQQKDDARRAAELKKLAKEQEDIQKELKKTLAKLQKLKANQAAAAGQAAAGKMQKAQQGQEDDDADEADAQQKEALANLDEAQDETQQAREDAEEQLAMEQLSKMADNLRGLKDQQDKLTADAEGYKAKLDAAKLTRAENAGLRGVGRAQGALKDEAKGLTERLDEAPVFALNLKRAADRMDEAARRLLDLKPDDLALSAGRQAGHRLQQLIDALKPDPSDGGPAGGQPPGGGGPPGGPPPPRGDGIAKAAQVKMLKLLQEEINERTEQIDTARVRNKGLTPTQEQELARLQDDQRGVADLARDLTRPKRADGEEE